MRQLDNLIILGTKNELGCLYQKTFSQALEFFEGLYSFNKSDPSFYAEQFSDLTPAVKELFAVFVFIESLRESETPKK